MKIKLEKVDKLYIHEEILPKTLHELVETIKKDNCLMHPIVVDKKSLVVLDGMHRIAAIRKLGCSFIPICLLDYHNPHVCIGSWYRTLTPTSNIETIKRLIERMGLTVSEEQKIDRAMDMVEKREVMASIAFPSKCYLIHGEDRDINGIYEPYFIYVIILYSSYYHLI